MTRTTSKDEYQNYLEMGKYGHFPLFFEEWMSKSLEKPHSVPPRKANHNVRQVFNLLSRHKTLDKKKTALISMDRLSREEFIRSFFKIIEDDILRENNNLQ